MMARYFAYGSNMNPDRVLERGLVFDHLAGARLDGFRLAFDKTSRQHSGVGHANIVRAPGEVVEGVLYWLAGTAEIGKMDRFESAPVSYSREVIQVRVLAAHLPEEEPDDRKTTDTTDTTEPVLSTWTYFANPAVRRAELVPPRSYLNHLLAGRQFLSDDYYTMLADWPCDEGR